MESKKINKPQLLGLVALLAIIFGVAGYKIGAGNSQPSSLGNNPTTSTAKPPAYKLLKYPKNWQETVVLNQAEAQAGVVSKATKDEPSATAIVRVQSGELEKNFDIKNLPAQITESLSKELADFRLVSQKTFKVGPYGSANIRYKQNGDDYLLVAVPLQDKAYYLTIKANSKDFSKLDKDTKKIIASLAGYIDSHK